MLKRTITLMVALFVGLAVCLVAFVLVASYSSSVQSCISQERGQATSETSSEQSGNKYDAVIVIRSYVRCAIRFADLHNALITAVAAVLLAVITLGLVWSGVEQQSTTRAQLRAYVLPEALSVVAADQNGRIITPTQQISVGTQPLVAITWKNFGSTPAFNVEMFGNVCLTTWPVNPAAFPAIERAHGSRQLLGPNAITTKWEIAERPLILSADHIAGLQNGTLACIAFGEVTYRDVFGRKQWTKYRYFTGGPTGIRATAMSAHDDGNDAT